MDAHLGGEEGPAVGGGAAAACAVVAVRHRPLLAEVGTARDGFKLYEILHMTTETVNFTSLIGLKYMHTRIDTYDNKA